MLVRATALLLLLAATGVTARAAIPPDAHYEAGMKAFEADDFSTAATELAASMKVRPDAKTALYLGNAYLKLEKLSKAKESFQQVLQIDPKTPKRNSIMMLIKNIDSRNVGTVKITSNPTGATVYLYDQPNRARGKTPLKLTLPEGTHRMIAKLKTYEAASKEVKLAFGETTSVNFGLRPTVCELTLTATPPGSQADVDSTGAVKVPAKVRVAQGEHYVTFSAKGYQSQGMSVSCEGGRILEELQVKAELARPKSQSR